MPSKSGGPALHEREESLHERVAPYESKSSDIRARVVCGHEPGRFQAIVRGSEVVGRHVRGGSTARRLDSMGSLAGGWL